MLGIRPVPTSDMMDQLAQAWELTKQKEAEIIAQRRAIEEKLVHLIGRKPEGICSKSTRTFKLKSCSKINRKVDVSKLSVVAQALNPDLFNHLFRTKYEVNTSALKALMKSDPKSYNVAAHAVISTPAKTSITVERMDA